MQRIGKVSQWNDAKGYGFILPDDGSARIFLHVKGLRAGQPRPHNGDRVTFIEIKDSDGRFVAGDVQNLEVKASPRKTPKSESRVQRSSMLVPGVLFFLCIIGGVLAWRFKTADTQSVMAEPAISTVTSTAPLRGHDFHCEAGKAYCSQMSSCAEATYYLQHCPNTQMDGDNDGIPCENQLCGH